MDPKQPEFSLEPGSTSNPPVNREGEDSTSDRATLSGLAATLDAQQSRLTDIERSLVERIADVDDDRRRTAVLLQRARQGQDEQIEERLRYQKQSLRWSLVAVVVLVTLGFAGLYWQMESSRKPLLAQIAALQQPRASGREIDALAQLDAEVTDLTVRIDSLSTSVAELQGQTSRGLSALDSRLEQLDSRKTSLADEIKRIDERLSKQEAAIQALSTSINGSTNTSSPSSPEAPNHRSSSSTQSRTDAVDQTIIIDEAAYALQIIGYFDLPRLRRFAATQVFAKRLYFREETYQGRPWYVLIYSLHGSYAEALEALSSLPTDLRTLEPLVRRLPIGTRLDLLIPLDDQDGL